MKNGRRTSHVYSINETNITYNTNFDGWKEREREASFHKQGWVCFAVLVPCWTAGQGIFWTFSSIESKATVTLLEIENSQWFLSYSIHMWVPTLAVTPAHLEAFWDTIYFYTASATAGNLSYDCAQGRHRTVSAAASRRHVDASLDSFTRKAHVAEEI